MAEENQGRDIARYRKIALAPEYLQQKDMGALEEALMSFQEGIGVQRNEDTEDATKIMMSNPKTLQDYLQNFMGKYQRELNASTLRDLRVEYSDLFEEMYTPENLPKVNDRVDSGVTYEEYMKRYTKVGEIAQSKSDNFTEEEKEKAKKDLMELNKIAVPLQKFEGLELDGLKGPIDKESLGKELNAAYEEKPEEEPKAA